MEFKNTTEALYIQAKEIVEAIAKIDASGEIHTIELDLLLEKLRNIYDLVSDMKNTLSETDSEIKPENPETETKSTHELEIETTQDFPEVEREEVTESNKDEDKDKGGRNGESARASLIADRFKASKPTLNEEMEGKSKDENLSSQLNLTPINSISGAIGLNEKFELINELFSGDKVSFENTLEVLNNADSFVEAYNYLNENFDWDMDSVYVQRILELIRRKLIVHRNEK